MPKISGNEPFHPVTTYLAYPGITIRQESILRFMVAASERWAPSMCDGLAKDAEKFADAYIKILNDEPNQ